MDSPSADPTQLQIRPPAPHSPPLPLTDRAMERAKAKAREEAAQDSDGAHVEEEEEEDDDDDHDGRDGCVQGSDALPPLPPALSASIHSSADAFVKGGLQEACDDSCAICLEPFSEEDPSTITTCKHDYHLQCILEWAQRSKECPMCLQPLFFEDPNSQELLDAVEHERSVRASLEEGLRFQVPSFVNYADFEERIMQHLAHQLARRGSLHNRISNMRHEAFSRDQASRSPTIGEAEEEQASPSFSTHGGRNRAHTAIQRPESTSDASEDGQQRTLELSSLSGSLKSRFLIASSKCKETFTKTTRSFRERWQGRSSGAAGLEEHSHGASPDHSARHALSRVSPESLLKGNDVPTTSSSSSGEESSRDFPPRGYTNLETRVTNNVPFDPPSEAV